MTQNATQNAKEIYIRGWNDAIAAVNCIISGCVNDQVAMLQDQAGTLQKRIELEHMAHRHQGGVCREDVCHRDRNVSLRRRARSADCTGIRVIIGRGGGKDSVATSIATNIAVNFDPRRSKLRPGEKAVVMLLAVDRAQAGVAFSYIRGYFEEVPALAKLVKHIGDDSIELRNHVVIEVHTNSYRSVRIADTAWTPIGAKAMGKQTANTVAGAMAVIRYARQHGTKRPWLTHRGSGEPVWVRRTLKCALTIETRSAQSIMASGTSAASTGRTHDRTRPMLQQRQKVLAKAPSTHDPKRTSRRVRQK